MLANIETRSQTDIFVREEIRLEKGTSGRDGKFSWRFSVVCTMNKMEEKMSDRRGTKLKWNKTALWL